MATLLKLEHHSNILTSACFMTRDSFGVVLVHHTFNMTVQVVSTSVPNVDGVCAKLTSCRTNVSLRIVRMLSQHNRTLGLARHMARPRAWHGTWHALGHGTAHGTPSGTARHMARPRAWNGTWHALGHGTAHGTPSGIAWHMAHPRARQINAVHFMRCSWMVLPLTSLTISRWSTVNAGGAGNMGSQLQLCHFHGCVHLHR